MKETEAFVQGNTTTIIKRAAINVAGSGDNTIVTAVTGKKIRVLALSLTPAAAVTARFESAAGGTALTGAMELGAKVNLVLDYNPVGWFETTAGALLNLELSGAISVDGLIVYAEV
tara:strand:+ start:850 stop:1197 length:348 start_codon:yes stop_codon:yes gene_type:complete